MTQYELIITSMVLVAVNIAIVIMWILQLRQSSKHFKITQIDFELAVQEQKRNQAESDVTQLRIEKAEFKANKRFEGDVKKIICDRLKQYEERRTPQTENRINELEKKKEKLGNCRK